MTHDDVDLFCCDNATHLCIRTTQRLLSPRGGARDLPSGGPFAQVPYLMDSRSNLGHSLFKKLILYPLPGGSFCLHTRLTERPPVGTEGRAAQEGCLLASTWDSRCPACQPRCL